MQINVRADSVEIEGYVNAVERKSKPLLSRIGSFFVEKIRKGAFKRSLERNDNVRLLLNHDHKKDLGGIRDGNLELTEDNIGLHARATITDPEVVRKARNGELRGWSFGFRDRDVEQKRDEDGYLLRNINDLDLIEVSLLDNTKRPAYEGNLVTVRSDESEDSVYIGEAFADEIQVREEKTEESVVVPEQQATVEENKINYDEWDKLINDMKN